MTTTKEQLSAHVRSRMCCEDGTDGFCRWLIDPWLPQTADSGCWCCRASRRNGCGCVAVAWFKCRSSRAATPGVVVPHVRMIRLLQPDVHATLRTHAVILYSASVDTCCCSQSALFTDRQKYTNTRIHTHTHTQTLTHTHGLMPPQDITFTIDT